MTNETMKPLDITNEKALDKAANAVIATYKSKKAREDVHLVLDALVRHAVKHNDASRLTNFWHSLPNNAPFDAMRAWIGAFSSLKYQKDKKGGKKFLSRDGDGKKTPVTYVMEGFDTPFYSMPEANKGKDATDFDPIAATDAFIKRMLREAKKDEAKMNKTQRESLIKFAGDVSQLEKSLEALFKPVKNGETGEVPFTIVGQAA